MDFKIVSQFGKSKTGLQISEGMYHGKMQYGIKALYPLQRAAFEALVGKQYFLLESPTASGKSVTLQALILAKMARSRKTKCIIAVPQTNIARSFCNKHRIQLPVGGIYSWSTRTSRPVELRTFLDFLRQSPESRPSRTIVVTHAMLLNVARQSDKFGDILEYLSDTVIVIDEAHHLNMGGIENNQLAKFIKRIIVNKLNTCVWLATATTCRGDNSPIIDAAHIDNFEVFSVSFEEFWDSTNLRWFDSSYVIYNNLKETIEEVLSRSAPPILVYCPAKNRQYLNGFDKSGMRNVVVDALKHANGDSYKWTPGDTKSNAIVDLTEQRLQANGVDFFNRHQDSIYAVVAVGMFKEGADWPPLQTIIDLAPSCSPQERVQKFGRALRDYPGKESFAYYTFFPKVTETDIDYRERCSEYFGQLILGLVDSSYYCAAEAWPVDKKNRHSTPTDRVSKARLRTVIEQVVRAVVKELSQHTSLSDSALRGLIEAKTDDQLLAEQIFNHLRRLSEAQNRVGVVNDLGFDEVRASGIFEHYRDFMAEACGTTTFRKMRELITTPDQLNTEEYEDMVREKLRWLQEHGTGTYMPHGS